MRARLKENNKLIPPRDVSEGLRRRRSLDAEIGRIQSQLNVRGEEVADGSRRFSAYAIWHDRATFALMKFKEERAQLGDWLVEQQQILLKSCLDLIIDFEPDEMTDREKKIVETLSLIFK